jgi:16S rRNA (cytosine1402-N4)-methyltransferase
MPQGDLEIIARIKPGASEIKENPRARSAVMRVAEKKGKAL